MIIYGIKNCTSMQKAFDLLKENGIEYEFHDYKKSGISEEAIEKWFKMQPWERFVNKKGTTWKHIDELVKSNITNEATAMVLMTLQTSVIKRPVIDTGTSILVGLDDLGEYLKENKKS